MNIFSKYGTLTVVAAVTFVLGVFVPDAQLKKIIFGVGLLWFIASLLAKKFGRKTSAHAKNKVGIHGDTEILDDLEAAFDDDELLEKIPEATLSYYRGKLISTEFSFYVASGKEYPLLKKDSWVPNPQDYPLGIFPNLNLIAGKNNSVSDSSALGEMYISAAKSKGQTIKALDIYALDKISEVDAKGNVGLDVRISDYEKFVRSSQVLNAELLLYIKHQENSSNSASALIAKKRFSLKLRDMITVGEFGKYVCKIGLNVLTVERNIDADRFFIMNRGNLYSVRPLEYPNANHVVPAGTVQPGAVGQEITFHDKPDDLLLKNTMYREFAEELFGDQVLHQDRIRDSVQSGEVKFLITGMGIDATSQKFEITALLVTPDSYMSNFQSSKHEGSNRAVDRDELIASATEVKKIIPAGAMAIFQGLKYLDSMPR